MLVSLQYKRLKWAFFSTKLPTSLFNFEVLNSSQSRKGLKVGGILNTRWLGRRKWWALNWWSHAWLLGWFGCLKWLGLKWLIGLLSLGRWDQLGTNCWWLLSHNVWWIRDFLSWRRPFSSKRGSLRPDIHVKIPAQSWCRSTVIWGISKGDSMTPGSAIRNRASIVGVTINWHFSLQKAKFFLTHEASFHIAPTKTWYVIGSFCHVTRYYFGF